MIVTLLDAEHECDEDPCPPECWEAYAERLLDALETILRRNRL